MMKNKRLIRVIGFVLSAVLIASLTACGDAASSGGGTSAPQVSAQELTYQITVPPGTSIDKGARLFADLVKERTDGRYTIEVFNSSSLSSGDIAKGIEMTQKGSITFCHSPVSLLSSFDPSFAAIILPWVWKNDEIIDKTLSLGSDVGKMLQGMMEENDMHIFGFVELGWKQISNGKREITKPEDLKDLKIRVISQMATDTYGCWGVNCTNITYSELFTALQQGAVDGQENPVVSTIYADKLYEAQKYITMWDATYEPQFCYTNKAFWDSLSEADKAVFTDACTEAMNFIKTDQRAQEPEAIADIESTGVKFYYLSDAEKAVFRESVQPVYDKWLPTLDPALTNAILDANK